MAESITGQALQSPDDDPARSNFLLSPKLHEFYNTHIDAVQSLLSSDLKLPRFVRLNPRYEQEETLSMLTAEMQHAPKQITWLDSSLGFFAVGGEFKLAQSASFRSGRVYGMDVSSGAAVAALLSDRYDKKKFESRDAESEDFRVLDLCCCPGLKLCAIADILISKPNTVNVVGVDISEQRLSLCKKIIKKYHVDPMTSGRKSDRKSNLSIRLYHADGVSFGTKTGANKIVFDSGAALEDSCHAGKRKRMNKSARAREKKKLGTLRSLDLTEALRVQNNASEVQQFDRVLVDAECTTDGSIKHMQQQLRKSVLFRSNETAAQCLENRTLTDPTQLGKLVKLQQSLISTGFRLLKSGGFLVYSTCSLSTEQNEHVVQWLLGDNPYSAELVPVSFNFNSVSVVEGKIPGTVRFLPTVPGDDANDFFGGGFFLAKIRKL